MTPSDIAQAYLTLLIAWEVETAFTQYIAPDAIHHNQYCAWDLASLKQWMIDNHENFPDKQYTLHQVVADGDIVVLHGLMQLNADLRVIVVHMFKILGGKIVEMRDVGQVLDPASPNQHGVL